MEKEYPNCRDVASIYEIDVQVGCGTYGEVFKARNKMTNKPVALKKILMEKETEGFPITALREITFLKRLKHDNIVSLIEVCRSKVPKDGTYLVFEFCEHDLAGVLRNAALVFSLAEIKKIMKQILEGLYFIHCNKILHRDMKSSNILLTQTGVIKLADFGLSRSYSLNNGQPNRYTNKVVTLWYRPPELLLGERNYGPSIDMWGVGCLMAELWTRRPILQGDSEVGQLKAICGLCGSIIPEVWPSVVDLDLFKKIQLPVGQKRQVKEQFLRVMKDQHAVDLLDKLLTLDPKQRIDGDEALNHNFFWEDPMPSNLEHVMSRHRQSMFEFSARRQPPVDARQAPAPAGAQQARLAPYNARNAPAPTRARQSRWAPYNSRNAPTGARQRPLAPDNGYTYLY